MGQLKPLISILTPTWNRCGYLDRVWKGLNEQSYKNIEWIVCDDGSTDDTAAKLRELGAKSTFPVTIVTASVRIGKARMDNEAIARASGEFILWNDSDDYLLPYAVEQLVAVWSTIPAENRSEYVGISALCASQWGIASSPLPQQGQFDTTFIELGERLKISGDFLYMVRAENIKISSIPGGGFCNSRRSRLVSDWPP